MRLSHARCAIGVRFDDPNLVSCAGLVAVMALATRCGLRALLGEHVQIVAKGGANASAKVLALIGGMVSGADSIADMDLLRHGGMGRLFGQVRAPSTLGTFLRLFTFGHVRQLDAVAARLLARLAAATPVLAGAANVVYLDLDDTVRQTYGYAKQGAGVAIQRSKGSTAARSESPSSCCNTIAGHQGRRLTAPTRPANRSRKQIVSATAGSAPGRET